MMSFVVTPESEDCEIVRAFSSSDNCNGWYFLTTADATTLVDRAHSQLRDGEGFGETELGKLIASLVCASAELIAWWAYEPSWIEKVEPTPPLVVDECERQLRDFPPELYLFVPSRNL